jgi:ABC-type Na+ efflux pump permease subunit/membrane protease YdiL (CAAX protease family)
MTFPRMNIVAAVFRKELRELLRDRRSLMIMFGVPIVLYPLLTVALGSLARSQEKKLKDEAAKVIVVNGSSAPHLLEQLGAAGSGIEVITQWAAPTTRPATTPAAVSAATRDPAAGLEPDARPTTAPTSPTTAPATASTADLESGKVAAMLEVPPDAQVRALAGEQPEFILRVNRSRFQQAAAVERKLEKAIRDFERWVIEQRLAGHGVPASLLAPLKTTTVDVATGGQRLGSLMATMLPLFILITGTLGSFFPAINATTTERERGTMETLLASPAGRTEVLVGKGLLVFLGGLVTAGLNLLSMTLVMRWLFASLARSPAMADLSIDPRAIGLAYLAAVPTLVFITGLVMVAGLFARTFQEANALALPVMLLPLASAAVGLTDPPTTPGLLATPIANTTVIIRDILTGRATVGAFLFATAMSLLYAGLLLSAAARVFNTEQLVNPSWEPLSIKGLGLKRRRTGAPRKTRLPSVDAAIALFLASLLLLLYSAPYMRELPFFAILLISSVVLVAAPALLLAWAARWPWVQTFALRRPPLLALVGGALVGIGLAPCINLLYLLQNRIWPANAENFDQIFKLFLPAVVEHPVLTPLLVGVLAGLCEELLYRGPIQTALLRRLPVKAALLIGATQTFPPLSAAPPTRKAGPVRRSGAARCRP